MSKKVTNRQLVFIIFFTLTTTVSTFLPKIMARKTEGGFWFTILLTAIIFSFLTFIIITLQNRYQGKMIFDYSKEIAGSFIATVITIIYALFFLIVLIFISTSLITMMKHNFLLKTPVWFIFLFTLLVSSYGAYKGITNIGRLFEIYGVLTLLSNIGLFLIMISLGNIKHIMPFFIKEDISKYFLAIKDVAVTFIGIEIIVILPLTKKNKRSSLFAVLTIIGICLYYILGVAASIMMVGMNEITHYNYSLLIAIRQIEIRKIDFLNRFDIVYLLSSLLGANAAFMIVNCASVECFTKVFPKAKRHFITIFIAIIAFIGGLFAFNIADFQSIFSTILTSISILTAAIIPIILLIFSRKAKT